MFLCHTDKIIGIPGIRTHVVEKKKDNGRKLYSPFESKVTNVHYLYFPKTML